MQKYNDLPSKIMVYPAILFMIIGMAVGVFISFNAFVIPDYFAGEYVHFGRVRPVHVHHVALLWLLSADVGLIYFIVPRLCGVPLWSPKLAYVTAALWWSALVIGVYSFPFGTNSGWEYAELPMFVGYFSPKVVFTLAWVLFGANIFATIANRRYKQMYVSLWYTMACILWTAITVIIGFYVINIVPGGMSRVNAGFFYVHNLVGLVFTPLGVAIGYYFIPKVSGLPLYSHRLSMIGFWTIALVYPWVGAHHIIHGPMTQWLQTVSIAFSLWLFIPVWTVVTNFFGTLKGHWEKYSESIAIRFLMMGNVFYLLVTMQGSLHATRNVNEIISKTDWIPAHAHMALFGTFTYFTLGGIYHAITVMTGKPLWSKALANWHFTLMLIGSMLFFVSLFVGGYLQGLQWASWASGTSYLEFQRNLSNLPFLDTVADMWIWWQIRAVGGLFILTGSILFAVNMFNTIVLKASDEETPSATAQA